MAKNNDVVPSNGGNGGIFSSVKGILLICGIAWAAISGTYAAGYKASDRTRIEVNKERKRHEKEKRRESKERRRARKRREKLELWKVKRGLTK